MRKARIITHWLPSDRYCALETGVVIDISVSNKIPTFLAHLTGLILITASARPYLSGTDRFLLLIYRVKIPERFEFRRVAKSFGNALTWILPVYQIIVKVAYASPQFARKTQEATIGRILKDSQISKVYTTSHEMSHTRVQSSKAMSKLRLLTY